MLLRGPSGAGKSDLVLRSLQAGWRLVADDRVRVWSSGGRAFGQAPGALHGLVEARGQAMLRVAARDFAPVVLVADLAGPETGLERLPPPGRTEVAGLPVPRLLLAPLQASALARLELAVQANHSPAAKAPL